MGWIKVTLPTFSWRSDCPSLENILVNFIIFEVLFHVAVSTQNLFCVRNGVELAHLSVVPKFYNSFIPLNEVWPHLPSKYFGKLSDIYQLNIVRLHLWKICVCSSWGELRPHYPVFLGVWGNFPLKNFGKFHYLFD